MKNTDADFTNEMWGRRENGRMLAIFACDFVASNRSEIQSCTRKLMFVPFFFLHMVLHLQIRFQFDSFAMPDHLLSYHVSN